VSPPGTPCVTCLGTRRRPHATPSVRESRQRCLKTAPPGDRPLTESERRFLDFFAGITVELVLRDEYDRHGRARPYPAVPAGST
jgi:hypothetical protein